MWCAGVLERLRHLQPYHLPRLYPPTLITTSTALSSETPRLLVAHPLWWVDCILRRLRGHRVLHARSEKHSRHNILPSHHTAQQSGVQLLPQQPITPWSPPFLPTYRRKPATTAWSGVPTHIHIIASHVNTIHFGNIWRASSVNHSASRGTFSHSSRTTNTFFDSAPATVSAALDIIMDHFQHCLWNAHGRIPPRWRSANAKSHC